MYSATEHNTMFFKNTLVRFSLLAPCFSLLAQPANADDGTENILIQGRKINTLGSEISASEGIVGDQEIRTRPMLRVGELLEFVPGMVVTQHSGSGKANQYFLRGFNLDHGTDFNTSIDGMPINMRTHGHGQGYTDLNFLIPELVKSIRYRKGNYYAEVGDFSAAGAAQFDLKNSLQHNEANITAGDDNYLRTALNANVFLPKGSLVVGAEYQQYDGPWSDVAEDVGKKNLIARYSLPLARSDFHLTFMAYDNQWRSADQIPTRAVSEGLIDRYGSLDTDLGGSASRYSLSMNWETENWHWNAYAVDNRMDLYSNFTYFLDDPINGDEFNQKDQRHQYGSKWVYNNTALLGTLPVDWESGIEWRRDDIGKVGLYHTAERVRLSTVREDQVMEDSLGLFYQATLAFTEQFHLTTGLRYDHLWADVDSNLTANSGNANDGLFSLKANLSYQHTDDLAFYASYGQGYHSNDVRGATISVDPASGENVSPVDLLVRSEGGELGFRYFLADTLNLSASLWLLDLDSELLFVGDAGNTEASRPSRRYGAEVAAYFWFGNDWRFDSELAWTHSRFTDKVADEGQYIDGALPMVASLGLNYRANQMGWQGALRLRHFGKRALESYNQVQAQSSTVVNANALYQWQHLQIGLEILNLLDSNDHDIDYYYTSRLSGEPDEGKDDLHYHPLVPRSFRVTLNYQF